LFIYYNLIIILTFNLIIQVSPTVRFRSGSRRNYNRNIFCDRISRPRNLQDTQRGKKIFQNLADLLRLAYYQRKSIRNFKFTRKFFVAIVTLRIGGIVLVKHLPSLDSNE
jgi:hypothetical protein